MIRLISLLFKALTARAMAMYVFPVPAYRKHQVVLEICLDHVFLCLVPGPDRLAVQSMYDDGISERRRQPSRRSLPVEKIFYIVGRQIPLVQPSVYEHPYLFLEISAVGFGSFQKDLVSSGDDFQLGKPSAQRFEYPVSRAVYLYRVYVFKFYSFFHQS